MFYYFQKSTYIININISFFQNNRLYNNVPTVSKLANQSNYHLFKEGIVPKWEDPMNENGGRWMFHVEKASRQVDNYFLRAMLACVGEQITSNDDEVCGVVATVKHSEDRISLWCYSTPEESSVTRICGFVSFFYHYSNYHNIL